MSPFFRFLCWFPFSKFCISWHVFHLWIVLHISFVFNSCISSFFHIFFWKISLFFEIAVGVFLFFLFLPFSFLLFFILDFLCFFLCIFQFDHVPLPVSSKKTFFVVLHFFLLSVHPFLLSFVFSSPFQFDPFSSLSLYLLSVKKKFFSQFLYSHFSLLSCVLSLNFSFFPFSVFFSTPFFSYLLFFVSSFHFDFLFSPFFILPFFFLHLLDLIFLHLFFSLLLFFLISFFLTSFFSTFSFFSKSSKNPLFAPFNNFFILFFTSASFLFLSPALFLISCFSILCSIALFSTILSFFSFVLDFLCWVFSFRFVFSFSLVYLSPCFPFV